MHLQLSKSSNKMPTGKALPVSATVVGEPAALCTICKPAFLNPAVVGVKETVTTVDCPVVEINWIRNTAKCALAYVGSLLKLFRHR